MTSPKSGNWADGPFKLISATKSGETTTNRLTGSAKIAAEMTMIHNVLIRGINSVYIQCENVATKGTDKDKLDFANFATQWGLMVEEHHGSEEEDLFPDINRICETPGLMDVNVNEHKLFHDGLEAYMAYLKQVKEGEEKLDGARLKGILDGFVPQLRDHLEAEIDTLLSLKKYEDKTDWVKWMGKKTNAIVMKNLSDPVARNDLWPLTMILHDKTFEDGVWQDFPPMPWIVNVVFQWLFMNTRKDWWRFAPCDFYSMPVELPFA